jgi:ribosomal protein S18
MIAVLPGGSFLKAQANKIISRYVTDTANQQVKHLRFSEDSARIQRRVSEESAKIQRRFTHDSGCMISN